MSTTFTAHGPDTVASIIRLDGADEPTDVTAVADGSDVGGRRGTAAVWFVLRTTGNLAVIAVTVALLVVSVLPMLEHRSLVVTSGSMEPLLSAGDVAIINEVDAEQLGVGDVITYQGYGTDRLTTHRIIDVIDLPSGRHFRTQGDANVTPDPNLAPATGVVGRYVAGVPYAGRFLLLLETRHGLLLIAGLPALLMLLAELRTLFADRLRTVRLPSLRLRPSFAALVMLVGIASGAAVLTHAAYTDTEAVGSNTFSTVSSTTDGGTTTTTTSDTTTDGGTTTSG